MDKDVINEALTKRVRDDDWRIRPGQSVGVYLDEAIDRMMTERGVKAQLQQKALDEKDKQQGGDDDIFGDIDAGGAEGSDEQEAPASPDTAEIGRQMGGPQKKQADDDVEALKAVPGMSDVVDKLNAVRSGRSFKDEDVKNAFGEYYEGLDDEEKVALFAFLKGIAQVTSGEVSGEEAVEPDTTPSPGIEMKRKGAGEPQQRSLKPNVIKKPAEPEPRQGEGDREEDTTSPVPVQPKRRG